VTIAVLGSANVDLVLRAPRRPRPGETVFGDGFTTGPGGKGLNQAVAARRAGADVAFAGAVGDDAFGAQLRRVLADEGIDAAALRTVVAPTGVALITVTDDGENAITVVAGANADAELADPARDRIAAATHLVAQCERPVALVREAFAFARAAGVTTVLTPAPVVAGVTDLLALTDLLIANADEARALSGVQDPAAAARALSATAGTVVATLGASGALAARAGDIVARVPGRPVPVHDTTGAGDTFAGVLVARLAAGDALDRALAVANAAAAVSVTRPGAVASMPTGDEIAAALCDE